MSTFDIVMFVVVGAMCGLTYIVHCLLEKYLPKRTSRGPLLIKFPDGRWETVQWSDDEDELNRRILHVVGEEVPDDNDPSSARTNGQQSPILTESLSEGKSTSSIQDN